MTNLIAFYSLITMMGYLVARLILRKEENLLSLAISFGLGLGINSVLLFIFSLLNIKLTAALIYFYLILGLTILIYINKLKFKVTFKLPKLRKEPILYILTFILMVIIFITFYRALSTQFQGADEWSYWGTATKRIYNYKTTEISRMGLGGFARYPLLVPINAASVNILNGYFAENFSKIISPLSFVFLLLLLFSFLKKKYMSNIEALALLVIFSTSGHLLITMSSILYADIIFAYLYTAGVLMLLLTSEMLNPRKVQLLAGLLLGLAAWTKIEGLPISLATILVYLLADMFLHRKSRKEIFSSVRWTLFPAMVIPALWFLYGKLKSLGGSGWTEKAFAVPVTGEEILLILIKMTKSLVDPMNFSGMWLFVFSSAVIATLFFKKKKDIMTLVAIVALNFIYLLSFYIFIFSGSERINAASFERYALHFLPLGVVLIGLVYQNAKSKIIKQ